MPRRSHHASGPAPRRGYAGFIDRLNARLLPWIGPPPLGPYDEASEPPAPPTCPICGQAMADHVIDRSAPRTQLHCPGGASAA
ncbi:hypothetical protein FLP10_08210 [Agromyces intestinalis]|uniref:Type IV secretion protein Rhs n=1 Tax=Agromyces intestinalis TaxID=2592652 RepID=A0A5C1YE78_9MICO|nr:hypothetical protein [Agromyces intestinalis]QEO14406.1 hypothetical protein FLP10_08210 [Agromyces intestinalis]